MPHSLLAGLFGFLHPLFLPGLSLPERTQRHTRPMSRKQTTILGCKWLEFRRVCLGCLSRTGAPAVLRFSALILRSTEQRIYPGSCEGVEPQDDGQYAGENKGPGRIGSTTVVTGKSKTLRACLRRRLIFAVAAACLGRPRLAGILVTALSGRRGPELFHTKASNGGRKRSHRRRPADQSKTTTIAAQGAVHGQH